MGSFPANPEPALSARSKERGSGGLLGNPVSRFHIGPEPSGSLIVLRTGILSRDLENPAGPVPGRVSGPSRLRLGWVRFRDFQWSSRLLRLARSSALIACSQTSTRRLWVR